MMTEDVRGCFHGMMYLHPECMHPIDSTCARQLHVFTSVGRDAPNASVVIFT